MSNRVLLVNALSTQKYRIVLVEKDAMEIKSLFNDVELSALRNGFVFKESILYVQAKKCANLNESSCLSKAQDNHELHELVQSITKAIIFYKLENLGIENLEDFIQASKIEEAMIYAVFYFNSVFNSNRLSFKTGPKDKKHLVQRIEIKTTLKLTLVQDQYDQAIISSEKSALGYNLLHTPANRLSIDQYVQKIYDVFPHKQITTLKSKEMSALNMHCLLAVGQGSTQESNTVIMEHLKGGENEPTLVLLGKGVMYDTGGLNIKGPSMKDMYKDMGGSASIVSIMSAVHQLGINKNIVGIVGLVENAIGNNAFRPGDVVTSMSGKNVFIDNTDAEGRLVLCDLISYAQKYYDPQILFTMATLTGGAEAALGSEYACLFMNDYSLLEPLMSAANKSCEHLWPMPMPRCKTYKNCNKTPIADIANVPNRSAGAGHIGAALFLQSFLTASSKLGSYPKFVHIDMALASKKPLNPYDDFRSLYINTLINFLLQN